MCTTCPSHSTFLSLASSSSFLKPPTYVRYCLSCEISTRVKADRAIKSIKSMLQSPRDSPSSKTNGGRLVIALEKPCKNLCKKNHINPEDTTLLREDLSYVDAPTFKTDRFAIAGDRQNARSYRYNSRSIEQDKQLATSRNYVFHCPRHARRLIRVSAKKCERKIGKRWSPLASLIVAFSERECEC